MLSLPIPFHTITVDSSLSVPKSDKGYDAAMSMTDKFTKLEVATKRREPQTGA